MRLCLPLRRLEGHRKRRGLGTTIYGNQRREDCREEKNDHRWHFLLLSFSLFLIVLLVYTLGSFPHFFLYFSPTLSSIKSYEKQCTACIISINQSINILNDNFFQGRYIEANREFPASGEEENLRQEHD